MGRWLSTFGGAMMAAAALLYLRVRNVGDDYGASALSASQLDAISPGLSGDVAARAASALALQAQAAFIAPPAFIAGSVLLGAGFIVLAIERASAMRRDRNG